MRWKGWSVVAVLAGLLLVPLVHQLFWVAPAGASVPYEDRFERDRIGDDYWWFNRAHRPRMGDGWLGVGPVQNNPLWLTAPLPDAVAIEFDVRSKSAAGDVKFEAFGNGRDHESGYVFILGGWNNTISVLARQDEHGEDRKERRDLKVEMGRTYHMRIVRTPGGIEWFVDGQPFLAWPGEPLSGRGHDRFGFSAWETPLDFDNLVITPL